MDFNLDEAKKNFKTSYLGNEWEDLALELQIKMEDASNKLIPIRVRVNHH